MVNIYELKARSLQDPMYHSLCRLRYDILVEEQQKKAANADHQNKVVVDDLDNISVLFIAEKEGQVIGMIRFTHLDQHNYSYLQHDYALESLKDEVDLSKAFVTTRYLVHQQFRQKRVAFDLVGVGSYQTYFIRRWRYSIVGSTDTIYPFHQRLGYRRYTPAPISFPEGMLVYPMILDLKDKDLLREIKSPLYRFIYEAPITQVHEKLNANSFSGNNSAAFT